MVKIEQKNKWAIDLSLHIPVPSFSLKITRTDETDEEILDTPLHIQKGDQPEDQAAANSADPASSSTEQTVETPSEDKGRSK